MVGNIRQWTIAGYKAALSGVLGGNLISGTLLGQPRRTVEYWQTCLFLWRIAARKGLPLVQLHELLPLDEAIDVTVLPTSGHFVQWEPSFAKDVMYLSLVCKALKPKVVFEIGTLYGYTALLFALNTGQDAKIYTLDLPADASFALPATISDVTTRIAHHEVKQLAFQGHPLEQKISVLTGDSACFDYSPWRDGVDIFFIDGSHSYEYVRSDTEHAFACCHPGSVILWHDYGRWGVNGVSTYLHELSQKYPQLARLPGSSLAILRVPEVK
jgi:hypothetical protein